MPYWQGAKLERRKGEIIGVSTRHPEMLKKSTSNFSQTSQQNSSRSSRHDLGIENLVGVKSRHRLTKIPLIPNRYRLELPVGDTFVVAAASFRSITIRFVTGELSKMYIDRGSGVAKFADATSIPFP